MQDNSRNAEPAGMPATILMLGKAVGLVIAIFLAPLVYSVSAGWIYLYFAHTLGSGLLTALATWAVIGLEVVIVFAGTAVATSFALSWLMTALVVRGLRQ